MTTTSTTNKSRTTGNGVTVAFPATIKIFAATDIVVTTINNTTDVLVNTLILNDGGALGFTVVFDTDAETLTVTVNTAPASGEDLQILRSLAQTQTTDLPLATKFPSVTVENALDKNTMILQDQQEVLDRTAKLPEESSVSSVILPNPVARKALVWTAAADGTIENSTFDPDEQATLAAASASAAASSASASASSATASASSATAAATSATNAATSETNAATSASNALTSENNANAAASAVGIQFTFDTSTVMADPGTGDIRFNNATLSSVTSIAVDALTSETGNPDISDYVATWGDSTNADKGNITIKKSGEPATFVTFSITAAVTDNTGWLQITVSHVASNGTFSASDVTYSAFSRAGTAGTGFNSSDITGQASAVVATGDEFVFADTSDSSNLKKDTTQGILDLVAPDLAGKADTVILAADKITFYDASDSDNPKTDTVQGILDLAVSGWEFISSITASNDATVAFTNMVDGFDYQYMLELILPVSDGVTLDAQVGIAGPTYRTTNYDGMGSRINSAGASSGGLFTTNIEISHQTIGNGTDEGVRIAFLTLQSPAASGVKTSYESNANQHDAGTALNTIFAGGVFGAAEAHTAVKFFMSGGNVSSGVIKQYRRSQS